MRSFFEQMSFRQLFSSYMYVVKAAETTYVRKICTFNIDEIDTLFLNDIDRREDSKNGVLSKLPRSLSPSVTRTHTRAHAHTRARSLHKFPHLSNPVVLNLFCLAAHFSPEIFLRHTKNWENFENYI